MINSVGQHQLNLGSSRNRLVHNATGNNGSPENRQNSPSAHQYVSQSTPVLINGRLEQSTFPYHQLDQGTTNTNNTIINQQCFQMNPQTVNADFVLNNLTNAAPLKMDNLAPIAPSLLLQPTGYDNTTKQACPIFTPIPSNAFVQTNPLYYTNGSAPCRIPFQSNNVTFETINNSIAVQNHFVMNPQSGNQYIFNNTTNQAPLTIDSTGSLPPNQFQTSSNMINQGNGSSKHSSNTFHQTTPAGINNYIPFNLPFNTNNVIPEGNNALQVQNQLFGNRQIENQRVPMIPANETPMTINIPASMQSNLLKNNTGSSGNQSFQKHNILSNLAHQSIPTGMGNMQNGAQQISINTTNQAPAGHIQPNIILQNPIMNNVMNQVYQDNNTTFHGFPPRTNGDRNFPVTNSNNVKPETLMKSEIPIQNQLVQKSTTNQHDMKSTSHLSVPSSQHQLLHTDVNRQAIASDRTYLTTPRDSNISVTSNFPYNYKCANVKTYVKTREVSPHSLPNQSKLETSPSVPFILCSNSTGSDFKQGHTNTQGIPPMEPQQMSQEERFPIRSVSSSKQKSGKKNSKRDKKQLDTSPHRPVRLTTQNVRGSVSHSIDQCVTASLADVKWGKEETAMQYHISTSGVINHHPEKNLVNRHNSVMNIQNQQIMENVKRHITDSAMNGLNHQHEQIATNRHNSPTNVLNKQPEENVMHCNNSVTGVLNHQNEDSLTHCHDSSTNVLNKQLGENVMQCNNSITDVNRQNEDSNIHGHDTTMDVLNQQHTATQPHGSALKFVNHQHVENAIHSHDPTTNFPTKRHKESLANPSSDAWNPQHDEDIIHFHDSNTIFSKNKHEQNSTYSCDSTSGVPKQDVDLIEFPRSNTNVYTRQNEESAIYSCDFKPDLLNQQGDGDVIKSHDSTMNIPNNQQNENVYYYSLDSPMEVASQQHENGVNVQNQPNAKFVFHSYGSDGSVLLKENPEYDSPKEGCHITPKEGISAASSSELPSHQSDGKDVNKTQSVNQTSLQTGGNDYFLNDSSGRYDNDIINMNFNDSSECFPPNFPCKPTESVLPTHHFPTTDNNYVEENPLDIFTQYASEQMPYETGQEKHNSSFNFFDNPISDSNLKPSTHYTEPTDLLSKACEEISRNDSSTTDNPTYTPTVMDGMTSYPVVDGLTPASTLDCTAYYGNDVTNNKRTGGDYDELKNHPGMQRIPTGHVEHGQDLYLKEHICFLCDEQFYTAKHLSAHVKIHKTKNGYQCLKCAAAFSDFTSLEKHITTAHKGYRRVFCSYCSRSFHHVHDLKSHIWRKHTRCPHCEMIFPATEHLLMHLMCAHKVNECDEGKPFICVACGKGFAQIDQFRKHMQTHTGEKSPVDIKTFHLGKDLLPLKPLERESNPLACSLCSEEFDNKTHLQKHMLTHKETNTFACSKKHMKTHKHTKVYICSICNDTFGNKKLLKVHMETHRENKTHVCAICNDTFVSKSLLKKHAKTHKPTRHPFIM